MKTHPHSDHLREASSARPFSSRQFMGGVAISAAGFQVVPGCVLGLNGATPPSGKLNIAGVGDDRALGNLPVPVERAVAQKLGSKDAATPGSHDTFI